PVLFYALVLYLYTTKHVDLAYGSCSLVHHDSCGDRLNDGLNLFHVLEARVRVPADEHELTRATCEPAGESDERLVAPSDRPGIEAVRAFVPCSRAVLAHAAHHSMP